MLQYNDQSISSSGTVPKAIGHSVRPLQLRKLKRNPIFRSHLSRLESFAIGQKAGGMLSLMEHLRIAAVEDHSGSGRQGPVGEDMAYKKLLLTVAKAPILGMVQA